LGTVVERGQHIHLQCPTQQRSANAGLRPAPVHGGSTHHGGHDRPLSSGPSPFTDPPDDRARGVAPAPSVVHPPWFSKPVKGGNDTPPTPPMSPTSATTSPTARGPWPFAVTTSSSPTPSWGGPLGAGKRSPDDLVAGADRQHDLAGGGPSASVPSSARGERAARTWGPSSPPPDSRRAPLEGVHRRCVDQLYLDASPFGRSPPSEDQPVAPPSP